LTCKKSKNVEPVDFIIRRNERWRRSAYLGLKLGVFHAPTRLWESIGDAFMSIMLGLGIILFGIFWFVFETALILIAGFTGYLTPMIPATSKS